MQIGFAKTPFLVAAAGLIIELASIDTLAQSEILFSHNRFPGEGRKNCITFVEKKAAKKEPPVKPIELKLRGGRLNYKLPGAKLN